MSKQYISLRQLTHLIVKHMRKPYPRAERLAKAALAGETCAYFDPGPWWPINQLPRAKYAPVNQNGEVHAPPGADPSRVPVEEEVSP